jgi:hypothetical protein
LIFYVKQRFTKRKSVHQLRRKGAAMGGSANAPASDGNARLIAAQAKSLRATLLRDRPPDLPISAGELADAVELIELLATELADDLEVRGNDA